MTTTERLSTSVNQMATFVVDSVSRCDVSQEMTLQMLRLTVPVLEQQVRCASTRAMIRYGPGPLHSH